MQDDWLDEARGVKQLARKGIFFYQLRALVSYLMSNKFNVVICED